MASPFNSARFDRYQKTNIPKGYYGKKPKGNYGYPQAKESVLKELGKRKPPPMATSKLPAPAMQLQKQMYKQQQARRRKR